MVFSLIKKNREGFVQIERSLVICDDLTWHVFVSIYYVHVIFIFFVVTAEREKVGIQSQCVQISSAGVVIC